MGFFKKKRCFDVVGLKKLKKIGGVKILKKKTENGQR